MNKPIHEYAAKGFDVSSEAYERGRPEYPLDAVEFLISKLALNHHSRVADLGAGTGKLSKILRKSCAKIIAIEPVEGMRKKFSAVLPDVEILEGRAEKIPLEQESMDAVVIAQAFHWFDGESALKEIYRVLKPGGKIGLLWNARDESAPWVAQLTKIIDPYERGAPRYKSGKWRKAFEETILFSKLEHAEFRHTQQGDVSMMVDRVGSISFIASLDFREKLLVLEKISQLVEDNKNQGTGLIELPYRTDVFVSTKL